MSCTWADTLREFTEIVYYFQSNGHPKCCKKKAWKTRFERGLDFSSKNDLGPTKLQVNALSQKSYIFCIAHPLVK